MHLYGGGDGDDDDDDDDLHPHHSDLHASSSDIEDDANFDIDGVLAEINSAGSGAGAVPHGGPGGTLPSPVRRGKPPARLPEEVCDGLRSFCSMLEGGYVKNVYLSSSERRQLASTVPFNSLDPNLLNTLDLTDKEYKR